MKKRLLLAPTLFVFSLVFAGAGCSWFGGQVANKAAETFTSIKDAVDRSIALQCEYTDESGEKTIASIKGKQIRMDSAVSSTDGYFHGIIRDNKMWIWADKQPEGMMLDFAKVTDDSLKMGDKVIRSQDDIISKLEEKKDSCKTANIADSDFNLPEGINFTDVQAQQQPTTTEPTVETTTTTKK